MKMRNKTADFIALQCVPLTSLKCFLSFLSVFFFFNLKVLFWPRSALVGEQTGICLSKWEQCLTVLKGWSEDF